MLTEKPPAPSETSAVPRELDRIPLSALAKEKIERYESVLYLRDKLQTLQESR